MSCDRSRRSPRTSRDPLVTVALGCGRDAGDYAIPDTISAPWRESLPYIQEASAQVDVAGWRKRRGERAAEIRPSSDRRSHGSDRRCANERSRVSPCWRSNRAAPVSGGSAESPRQSSLRRLLERLSADIDPGRHTRTLPHPRRAPLSCDRCGRRHGGAGSPGRHAARFPGAAVGLGRGHRRVRTREALPRGANWRARWTQRNWTHLNSKNGYGCRGMPSARTLPSRMLTLWPHRERRHSGMAGLIRNGVVKAPRS